METAANNLHRTLHLAQRSQEPGSPFRSLRLNGKALAPPDGLVLDNRDYWLWWWRRVK